MPLLGWHLWTECVFARIVPSITRGEGFLSYAKASGSASSHRPCAFKISSITSRAARPGQPSRDVVANRF